MDDGTPVNFTVTTPDSDAACANMALNERRALPEAVPLRSVIIVGSGPSARDEALWERLRGASRCLGVLRTDHPDRPAIVALNGALKLFLERGLKPDYWCACDPQGLVLDFLPDDPPRDVTYLLASKVHPSVFDRLRGRDVRIWRLDDFEPAPPGKVAIPCAVSITLVTQALFRALGYHRFEMYGWDCCYIDGEHHASRQPAPLAEHNQPVELRRADGEVVRRFETTGSWMCEAADAEISAANFKAVGLQMVVHGEGMVGSILRGRGLI